MTFKQRLREHFTNKKILSIGLALIVTVILRHFILQNFEHLKGYDFSILLPAAVGGRLTYEIAGLYYEHYMAGNVITKDNPIKVNKLSNVFFMDNNSSNTLAASDSAEARQMSVFSDLSSTQPDIKPDPDTQMVDLGTLVPEPAIVAEHVYSGNYNPQNRTRSPSPEPNAPERNLKLDDIDKKAREKGLFKITKLNDEGTSIRVSYYVSPWGSWNNKEKMGILRRLWELFPQEDTETKRLDSYRLMGRVWHDLDRNSVSLDNWTYNCHYRKRPDQGVIFNPNMPKGHYQPWASDIAERLKEFKSARGTGNVRPKLDPQSSAFLTSYQNIAPTESGSSQPISAKTIKGLKEL